MRDRKHTAWRKNRRFGEIHGGRTRLRLADNVFRRVHSLKPPAPSEPLPVCIADNPSRDHFFPLDVDACAAALRALPERDRAGITHLWLRRPRGRARRHDQPLARYACGNGVRLVELFAWRHDRRLPWRGAVPTEREIRHWQRFGAVFAQDADGWFAEFPLAGLQRLFVHLLCHEVGHHVDWYRRHWSPPSLARCEEAAEQYAFRFTARGVQALRGDGDAWCEIP